MSDAIPDLKKADNGVFYIHWTEGRRSKRISTRQKDFSAAKAFFATWLREGQTAAAEAGASLTCGEIWALYDQEHVQRKVLHPSQQRSVWNNLQTFFGELTLADITQKKIDAYERKRAAGEIGVCAASASTIRKELLLLRASWNHAVRRKHISRGDVPVDLELPEDADPRDRWLREAEIEALLKEVAAPASERMSRTERFIWLALETASRRAALETLRWSQIDFETKVIHLNPPGRRQTKKRRADVPISDRLLPVLQRAYAERVNDLVLDSTAQCYDPVARAARRAGVEGVTPHVFRHTAATHMARRGVPLWQIAKVLGNTIAMVEKVYAKHCPDDLKDAVNAISGGRKPAIEEEDRI